MVILDLEVLGTISRNIVKNIKHQKDARRNSVQKDVLNSSPSFFSTSLVKKMLIKISLPRSSPGENGQQYWSWDGGGSRAPGLVKPTVLGWEGGVLGSRTVTRTDGIKRQDLTPFPADPVDPLDPLMCAQSGLP